MLLDNSFLLCGSSRTSVLSHRCDIACFSTCGMLRISCSILDAALRVYLNAISFSYFANRQSENAVSLVQVMSKKKLKHSPLPWVLAERNWFLQNNGKYFRMTDGAGGGGGSSWIIPSSWKALSTAFTRRCHERGSFPFISFCRDYNAFCVQPILFAAFIRII